MRFRGHCATGYLRTPTIVGPARPAGNGGFFGIHGYVSRFTPKPESVVEEYLARTSSESATETVYGSSRLSFGPVLGLELCFQSGFCDRFGQHGDLP
jgi:hypothetical protein